MRLALILCFSIVACAQSTIQSWTFGHPRLNQGHPLSRGLMFLAVAANGKGSVSDLVRIGRASTVPTWSSSPGGSTMQLLTWAATGTTDIGLEVSTESTIGVFLELKTLSSSGQGAYFFKGSADIGWVLFPMTGGAPDANPNFPLTRFQRNNGTPFSNLLGSASMTVGTRTVAQTSHVVMGRRRIYVNGLQQNSTVNNTSPLAPAVADALTITQDASASAPYYLVAIWNRELSAGEMLDWQRNPVAMIDNGAFDTSVTIGGGVASAIPAGILNNPIRTP
jgi:hypothetical protein